MVYLSIHTETDQHFHNLCLWCSHCCRSTFPSLRILLTYVVFFWMTCDPHALPVKVFVPSDRGERALVAVKTITNHLLITPLATWSCLQVWKPMLCHDLLAHLAHLALPSHLSFWSLQRQVVPLAFLGLGSVMTAAPGPWNYCLIHTLNAWLCAQWYYWTFPCLSIVRSLFLPQWSEDVCAAHLTQRDGFQATTQGQLKEQLYQEIIHYFDKGKVRHTHCPLVSYLCLRLHWKLSS